VLIVCCRYVPFYLLSVLYNNQLLFHFLRMVQWYADQPGQSTVEYVTDVWLDLITIVDGWYMYLLLDAWWYWFCLVCVLTPALSVLMQNNCIGEKNTRYFVAFLVWWVLIFLPLFHVSIFLATKAVKRVDGYWLHSVLIDRPLWVSVLIEFYLCFFASSSILITEHTPNFLFAPSILSQL
jgi:hypothetical protein